MSRRLFNIELVLEVDTDDPGPLLREVFRNIKNDCGNQYADDGTWLGETTLEGLSYSQYLDPSDL